MRKLVISAKCSDLCDTEYYVDDELQIEVDGYAPDLPGISEGDYVSLEIDLDTGKILNYTPIPHKKVMEELTGEEFDDDDLPEDPAYSKENLENMFDGMYFGKLK